MDELILYLVLIVFAVFGLYCLIRLLWECIYVPKGMTTALVIESREDIRELNERLSESLLRLSVPNSTILVLVPEALYESPDLRDEIEGSLIGYNAEIVTVREAS